MDERTLFLNIGEQKSGKLIFNLMRFGYLEKFSKDVGADCHQMQDFYMVSRIGYEVFDPWYKKGWRFFTNNFAKCVSLISIILSIIATIISMVR